MRPPRDLDLSFPEASSPLLPVLRYVEDPGTTLRELARVVRAGGRIAALDFSVPRNPLARIPWEAYVRVGLPLAGRAISPGWAHVGRFLASSIREFSRRNRRFGALDHTNTLAKR